MEVDIKDCATNLLLVGLWVEICDEAFVVDGGKTPYLGSAGQVHNYDK